jgi:paraquat-inducible protein B
MTDEADMNAADIAETVAERVTRSCGLRHERLDRIEAIAQETAQTVKGHEVKLSAIDERLTGLTHAHAATLVAVEACTRSNDRLSGAIDRLEEWLKSFSIDLAKQKDDLASHQYAQSRDAYALPRVVLWLWLMTITAFGSVVAFFITEWHEIISFISKSP